MDTQIIRDKLQSPEFEKVRFALEALSDIVNSGFRISQESIKNQTILSNDIRDLEAGIAGIYNQLNRFQGHFTQDYMPEFEKQLLAQNNLLQQTRDLLDKAIFIMSENQAKTEERFQLLADHIESLTPKTKVKI